VFAPNSPWRGEVTPGKRGRRIGVQLPDEPESAIERRAAMGWAQRLKRVFRIDIETCVACGGVVKVVSSIEDPAVIAKILAHVRRTESRSDRLRQPQPRAPPDGWG